MKSNDDYIEPTAARDPSSIFAGMAILYNNDLFRMERVSVSSPTGARTHHYHDAYEFYYLYSGDRYYFIKDKTYHVKRGNIVLVKPYEIHSTTNFSKSGYDRILITFKKSYLDGFLSPIQGINLFECFEKDIHLIKLNFQEQSFIETLMFSMLEEYNSANLGYEYFLKTALIQLLVLISRYSGQLPANVDSYASSMHKTVFEVASYINNNYREDITLALVAEKFFISPCYFSRIFKKVTGVPFTEYVNGVRIKEAQRLLVKSDLSMAEIAETVGYRSTTHFGRIFKTITGISPIAYRRRRRSMR